MIQRLLIENFKTIRSLDLPCKRYNLFIGDTNTGKTNILEALTLLSENSIAQARDGSHQFEFDRRIIRYGQLNDLFPGRDVTKELLVSTGDMGVKGTFANSTFRFEMTDFIGDISKVDFQASGNQVGRNSEHEVFRSIIGRYHYDPNARFAPSSYPHLAPPDGCNLGALIMANAELADEVSEILAAKDVAIEVNPETYAISLRHSRAKNVVVPIAFQNLSETLSRYLFLYVAIRTNKDAVLLLDEPEQNTYPFYTKHIAELMAREPSNQYFITTHNQYFLQSIIEKAPKEEVQVFVTYRKDGATQVRMVPIPEVMEMLEYDLFLNLDRLVDA